MPLVGWLCWALSFPFPGRAFLLLLLLLSCVCIRDPRQSFPGLSTCTLKADPVNAEGGREGGPAAGLEPIEATACRQPRLSARACPETPPGRANQASSPRRQQNSSSSSSFWQLHLARRRGRAQISRRRRRRRRSSSTAGRSRPRPLVPLWPPLPPADDVSRPLFSRFFPSNLTVKEREGACRTSPAFRHFPLSATREGKAGGPQAGRSGSPSSPHAHEHAHAHAPRSFARLPLCSTPCCLEPSLSRPAPFRLGRDRALRCEASPAPPVRA